MNILLTSAGRRTYLVEYFQEVLKGKGKVYASNSTFSPALNTADDYVISPLIYDDNYIPFLLNFVKENNIKIIISLFDVDLPVLAKAKDVFLENGVTVIVSDYEVTEICNDKWKSYNFFIENGFNTPKTYINYGEVQNDLEKKVIEFPLIIKPRWGLGSIGIYEAEDGLELEVLYRKVKKEIEKSYLKFESKAEIDRAVLIQERIKGQEYGLDIFNDLHGNHLKTFVKKKTAMRSGETDSAVTEFHENLQESGRRLSSKLRHIGNLDSDWFLAEGNIYILEINCRFGGGYPFTHLAGANLPRVLIDLMESNTYNSEDLEIDYDLEMIKEIKPVKIEKN